MQKTHLFKVTIAALLLILIIAVLGFFFMNKNKKSEPTAEPQIQQQPKPVTYQPEPLPTPVEKNLDTFVSPIERPRERVTKKPFGIFITKKDSPVQPERFAGYHTGADFEIFPEELDVAVPVKAVCSGELLVKRIASGYGGVAVQSCQLDGAPATVVYGHLNLASIKADAGDNLNMGDILGNLGADKSMQTDGERKHLHLGFHKGSAVDLLGYVGSKAQLEGWLDPCEYVCK